MSETQISVHRRTIAAGDARCAVFTRTYDAPIDDVWDACTNPKRLSRWYAPIEGDLQVGGDFTQGNFGPGHVLRCEAPNLLTVALGGGVDEIELRLSSTADGQTLLEFEHATTIDTHEIGGQIFDAVYCMGGGYGPRLVSLEQHLAGTLSEDIDPNQLQIYPEYRAPIENSMATLDSLLKAGF